MTATRLLLAVGFDPGIVIDGIYYRVPRIDAGGRVYVNVKATGASEVKSLRAQTSAPSNTRATAITPTSGKKVRIISVECLNVSATGTRLELYFGTGTSIGINPTKAIVSPHLDVDFEPNYGQSWPDGGGPVGDAGEVVSIRTGADLGANSVCIIHYREE